MTTVSTASSSPSSVGCWQWLERVDSNNRRNLAPHVATGVRALTRLATHLNFPGPWQAITSLFYTVNIILIPSSTEKFAKSIIDLKNKKNWLIALNISDIRALFQSILPLLVSTTFTTIGLKDACQLLGYAVRSLEGILNSALPWIVGACRITVIFQVSDITKGLKLRSEINRKLALTKTNSADKLSFCLKALKTIEKHRDYLHSWDQLPSLLKWKALIDTQMGSNCRDCQSEEKLSRLTEKIVEAVSSSLQWSDHRVRYQVAGLLANAFQLFTLGITNSAAISVLLLGASLVSISREI